MEGHRAQENKVLPELEPLTWMFWKKKRYLVLLLVFIGMINILALRVNISVAIVSMTAEKSFTYDNGTTIKLNEFPWDSRSVGFILSSFFYGAIVTGAFGGYIARKIGNVNGFLVGVGATCILTLLTPLAANIGIYCLIFLRILIGGLEAIAYPCMYGLWSKWAPPLERSRIMLISYSGGHCGTVFSMFLSGLITEKLGWEYAFYILGGVGSLWIIFWIVYVRESPGLDKRISADELRYISESLNSHLFTKNPAIPWKSIMTSVPMLAICVAHFAETWGFFTFLMHLPTFLKDTLHCNAEIAGYLSALPYGMFTILSPFCGYASDKIIFKGWLTVHQTRRYFTCGSFLAQVILLLMAIYLENPIGTCACIVIAISCGSFAYAGFSVNVFDIAPQFANVLFGIELVVSTIPGIVSPTLTGYIVQNQAPEEWQIVFYIAASMFLFGVIVYWCLSSCEIQPWAKVNPNECDDDFNSRKMSSTVKCDTLNHVD